MPINPLKMLQTRFATYTAADAEALRANGEEPREDGARDRRLEDGEEARIWAILGGEKPAGKQRALTLEHGPHLVLLFDIALETGMCLSELYTLDRGQIDIQKRTIFLDRTKNGDKRQVALSSVVIQILGPFLGGEARVFPWWDGAAGSRPKTTSRLSVQFGRIFRSAGCVDLTFRDLRHEATCRLYERTQMSDVEIAKQLGWKSLKMALRYGNLRAATQAAKLW